jgi:hypothetical protein
VSGLFAKALIDKESSTLSELFPEVTRLAFGNVALLPFQRSLIRFVFGSYSTQLGLTSAPL